ncbi:MAG: DUF3341 domain-containing protein [Phycisphaeraceae bacterium]|nr:DUF3341 domain-containing protein [Phycisphaeraceae bacterium]
MAAATREYRTERGAKVYGVLAEFPNPGVVSHAAERVRDAGYSRWDVYSPFPIHGIDDAMGLPATKLPLVVAFVGLTGACLGFIFQYWVSTEGYATVVQGKPAGAWQAFIPVTFEIGVLFTAFTALLGMLAFNGLPRWHHPLMTRERFLGVGDDKFFIAIEADDPRFDPEPTRALLVAAGATSVELVEEELPPAPAPAAH